MNRKKLLIAGGLIVTLLVLLGIGISITISSFNIVSLESSLMASTMDGDQSVPGELTYFNDSTPGATAISTAQLTQGVNGFYGYPDRVYLTSDGKYWMVHVLGSYVTVDTKTGVAKDENGEWKSLDELKANYIADVQISGEDETLGKSQKIIVNGKEIWKVPVHEWIYEFNGIEYIGHIKEEPTDYIYVDLETGKSKRDGSFEDLVYNLFTGTGGWLTLKQIDSIANCWPYPFRDALRNLYPE
ncbi:MAG TPA: hypothetical protein VK426_09835 [Methanobacterium sp.]|nr:hypothetical protein [Methanobacterium sp.]